MIKLAHILTATVLALGRLAYAADFYVSPEGNDAWTGKLEKPNAARTDGPLASLVGARNAIRKIKASGAMQTPIRVLIGSGQYAMSEPLTFEPEDSGTEQCPITYFGDPGNRPVICGGRQITGWKKQGDRWIAHLPDVEAGKWTFAALWVGGERRVRARMPNEGSFFYTAGKAPPIADAKTGKPASSGQIAFRFKRGDIKRLGNLGDAIFVVYQSWEVGHQRIASVDEAKRVVTFKSPLPWAFDYWGGGVRYFVENVPEALDAPGEWYLDRKTGTLAYIPFPGEDLTKATVVAPVAKQLILISGKPAAGQFVSHLRLENLRLLYTDWEVPPQGHAAGQAACDFPGAIEAVGARHCTVEGCEIAHLGTYGVWLRQGCQDNRIAHNDIHDLGAGGVRLGEQGDPPTAPETAATQYGRQQPDPRRRQDRSRRGGSLDRPDQLQPGLAQRDLRPVLHRHLGRLELGLCSDQRASQHHRVQPHPRHRPGSARRHGRHLLPGRFAGNGAPQQSRARRLRPPHGVAGNLHR